MTRVGLIPAAGAASRIGNVPKFFLPVTVNKQVQEILPAHTETESLLKSHVRFQLEFCDVVIVLSRPEWMISIEKHLTEFSSVKLVSFNSASLVESILVGCAVGNVAFERTDEYFLSLPDSVFDFGALSKLMEGAPVLQSDLEMFCWGTSLATEGRFGEVKINNQGAVVAHEDKPLKTTFEHFWGALRFRERFRACMSPDDDNLVRALERALGSGEDHPLRITSAKLSGDYFDVGTLKGYRSLLNSFSL